MLAGKIFRLTYQNKTRGPIHMSDTRSVAPEGYTSVAPWVVTDDTGAFLDFVAAVFDGDELGRVQLEDGSIGHGEARIGDTVVLAFDRRTGWPTMPSLLRVFVPDCDVAFDRAITAGGTVVTELSNDAFGMRGGRIRDPFGNIWWVVTKIEDVPEDLMWQRLQEPRHQEVMRVAQETLDAELSGRAGTSSAVRAPQQGS
jgi:PhnB protein